MLPKMFPKKSIFLGLSKWTSWRPIVYRSVETTSQQSHEVNESTDEVQHHQPQYNLSGEEEFRTLQLRPPPKVLRDRRKAPFFTKNIPRPRTERMSTDQHWPSVWPAARVFHPAVVPLPLHMGYVEDHLKDRISIPDKWANAELMKIPNFLHLTPPAVKAHCQVLKKFCTPWPQELKTDEDCEQHFPLEFVFTDFIHATPTIRDPRARMVKLRFKTKGLPLDHHAKDKMIRLVNCNQTRYNAKTGEITLISDRCPMKKQNYDFLQYLLTATFFESWKTEEWELTDKTPQDWEKFYWTKSDAFKRISFYLQQVDPDYQESTSSTGSEGRVASLMEKDPRVKSYESSLSSIFESGENKETLAKYKEAVVALLFDGNNSTEERLSAPES